ncbi:hypothetical protein [Microbacterium hydrocarbonoxydans]|uniref:hypothetical protein n=1 Tax=Microbacterium hydrocarbonoxydans TaxID=273678 RepID=UPI0020C840B4|nr:hypothetical protein [Microbacterium hydrocarbonoxydans]
MALAVVLLIVALVFVLVNQSRAAAPETGAADGPQVVRENSHVSMTEEMGRDGGRVPRFRVRACGAFYPLVEDLRGKFDGEITYVIRYFPLPGHLNSKNAAIAAKRSAAGTAGRDVSPPVRDAVSMG